MSEKKKRKTLQPEHSFLYTHNIVPSSTLTLRLRVVPQTMFRESKKSTQPTFGKKGPLFHLVTRLCTGEHSKVPVGCVLEPY